MVLSGDLGLDVVREVVGIVAGEDEAARHGPEGLGRVHLLDTVVVMGVNDGGDVEVGLALPARELDLSEHARNVLLAVGDGIEVADVLIGKLDGGLLGIAHNDGVHGEGVLVGGEVDGALDVIKSPEGDRVGASKSGRADKGKDRGSEMHLG